MDWTELANKHRRGDGLPKMIREPSLERTNFIDGPEAATVKLLSRGSDWSVVSSAVHVDQLALAAAVKNILPDAFWREIGDAETSPCELNTCR